VSGAGPFEQGNYTQFFCCLPGLSVNVAQPLDRCCNFLYGLDGSASPLLYRPDMPRDFLRGLTRLDGKTLDLLRNNGPAGGLR
jgi:hypothetical protein